MGGFLLLLCSSHIDWFSRHWLVFSPSPPASSHHASPKKKSPYALLPYTSGDFSVINAFLAADSFPTFR